MSEAENGAAPSEAQDAGEDATVESLSPAEAQRAIAAGEVELIDVRTAHEWEAGHVPGARHVPLNELSASAAELPRDRELLIYCRAGGRSAFAAEGLRQGDFRVRAIEGGALAWAEQNLPLEPTDGYVAESGEAAAELEARERTGARPTGIDY